jgi:predicted Zn-dependent protease
MKPAIMFCAIALTIFAASHALSDDHGEVAAESAAVAWLTLVDTGKYDESWNTAATLFRQAISQEQWQSKVARARGSLGALKSRKLQSAALKRTLPGAPDGAYVVIQFASSFEQKTAAIETVTPMKDADGSWRVSGYYIK